MGAYLCALKGKGMELQQLELLLREQQTRELFADIITINGLNKKIGISVTAVMNAIDKGKLVAMKIDGDLGEHKGVWLVSIKSARQVWPKRFAAKELHHAN